MTQLAAISWPGADRFSVEGVEVDPPRAGEVLVRIEAAGLCHSDVLLNAGGYQDLRRPIVGGHEGAGVVEAIGPMVTSVSEGDHVVFAFMPSCGACWACITNMPHLCEVGALIGSGMQLGDGTARWRARGQELSTFCFTGAFATRTVVNERSVVVIDRDVDLSLACLLGCAGVTGWGAAVNSGQVRPGDTTVVVGIGGVGAMALLGSRHAGASQLWAVDPIEFKRSSAMELGADAAVGSMAELLAVLPDATRGRMANQVILCMGEGDGSLIAEAMSLLGKGGAAVVVNVHPEAETEVRLSLRDLQYFEKRIVGVLGGSWSPRRGIQELVDLHQRGRLPLDRVVTAQYPLTQINRCVADQAAGRVVRGVLRPSL